MIDYAKEEMAGYQSEIDRIKDVLKSLPDSCRPDGWVGLIHYVEEKVMSATITVSKSGTFASTSTQKVEDSWRRTARILYSETGTPHGDVSVYSKTTRNDTATTRTTCDSSGRTTIPDRSVTRTSDDVTEVSGTGQEDVSASFNFDPATGKVHLSFEAPGASTTGTFAHSESAQGECNPSANGTKTFPPAPFSTNYDKSLVALEGVGARNGDRVQGSKTIDLTNGVKTPNVSLSHQAIVKWSLYKIN
jgi:hypothetical protein